MTVLACSEPPTSFNSSARSINGLYVFGDSLSAVGTSSNPSSELYSPSNSYAQGRYSNGRVWVEYLADRLQLAQEQTRYFAYGGATTGHSATSSADGGGLSLVRQVEQALQSQQSNPLIYSDALFVVWAGANDYLQGDTNPKAVVTNIIDAIASLGRGGAQHFLVANLPDLGQLPATRDRPYAEALSDLSQNHNQELSQALSTLVRQSTATHLQIVTFDVYRLYQEALTQPRQFGFTNVMDACLINDQIVCEDPGRFLFWDGIHPTTAAHQILSDASFRALQENGFVN